MKRTPATAASTYRVRFVIDPEAEFEEWNGENRPLTEEEYDGNEYHACPQHSKAGTQLLALGDDTHPQVQGCAICKNMKYRRVSYEEYRQYYGNPDRHVYLMCEVQRQCGCCGKYDYVGGTGFIDMMDDSNELHCVNKWLTEEQVEKLGGHLGEIAREDLAEAKH